MAIQAVAAELRSRRKQSGADDTDPDLAQLIDDYESAAAKLEDAYDETAKTVINLPPYDELVGG